VTIIGIFTGMLLPLFLSFGGIRFGDDISVALQNETLRNGAFKYQSLLAFIGSIICSIPIFFYDLTEAKHADIVRALKLRAAADNYEDGVLQDIDVINVKEIMDNPSNGEFVKEEIGKHDYWSLITVDYDAVKGRVTKKHREEDIFNFLRDIDLEEKRVMMKYNKAREDAEKRGTEFDQSLINNLKSKERFLRYFVTGELSSYKTVEAIAGNSDVVYQGLERIWEEEAALKEREKLRKQEERKNAKK
jgi:hypothetical protein